MSRNENYYNVSLNNEESFISALKEVFFSLIIEINKHIIYILIMKIFSGMVIPI